MPGGFERARTNESPMLQLEKDPAFASLVTLALTQEGSPEEVIDCLRYISRKPKYRDLFSKVSQIDADQLNIRMKEVEADHGSYTEYITNKVDPELTKNLRTEVEDALFFTKPLIDTWKQARQTAPLVRAGVYEYLKRGEPFDPDVVYNILKVLVPEHNFLATQEAKLAFRNQINGLEPPSYASIIAELDKAWGGRPVDKLPYTAQEIFSLTESSRTDQESVAGNNGVQANTQEGGTDA